MIRSMTGFGSAAGERGGAHVQAEVRSVNHRYLQVKSRLPADLAALEPQVEALLRKRLERGSVTATVNVTRAAADSVSIDVALARRYARELSELSHALERDDGPSFDALLALPGVVAVAGPAGEDAAVSRLALHTLKEAVDALVAMREAEGEALRADLVKHARALARLTARIEKRMPTVVRAHQQSLKQRIELLLDGRVDVQGPELARELAVIADKGDVSEEVARIASHLEQLDGLLDGAQRAVGRRLDFLVQELFREVNTIGSKCGDAQVAHWVVEAKTVVERLREQVQNVE